MAIVEWPWVVRNSSEQKLQVARYCEICEVYMPIGELVKGIDCKRRGKLDWTLVHTACADWAPVDLNELTDSGEAEWIEGTQREFVEFLQGSEGAVVSVVFVQSRPKGARYRYRVEQTS